VVGFDIQNIVAEGEKIRPRPAFLQSFRVRAAKIRR
jgi:hypothetical protein